jgi:hypothetical protein
MTETEDKQEEKSVSKVASVISLLYELTPDELKGKKKSR